MKYILLALTFIPSLCCAMNPEKRQELILPTPDLIPYFDTQIAKFRATKDQLAQKMDQSQDNPKLYALNLLRLHDVLLRKAYLNKILSGNREEAEQAVKESLDLVKTIIEAMGSKNEPTDELVLKLKTNKEKMMELQEQFNQTADNVLLILLANKIQETKTLLALHGR